MKDYNVKIKVRNNRLLQAIYDAGGEPGKKWCDANGLNYTQVNDLINMTISPIKQDTEEYTKVSYRLCEVLNKSPSELWTDAQLTPLAKNTTEFDMSQEQVTQLMNKGEQSYLPDLDKFELSSVMERAMDCLTERELFVLKSHYFDSMTFGEIGDEMGISGNRVAQIEMKALRKLRHPNKSDELRYFLVDADQHHEDKQEELRQANEIGIVEPFTLPKYVMTKDNHKDWSAWWDSIGRIAS